MAGLGPEELNGEEGSASGGGFPVLLDPPSGGADRVVVGVAASIAGGEVVVESGATLVLPRGIVRVVWGPRSSVVLLTAPAVSLVCLGSVIRATEPVTMGKRELLAAPVRPVAPALGRIVDVALAMLFTRGLAICGDMATGATELVTTGKRELLAAPCTSVTPSMIIDVGPPTVFTTETSGVTAVAALVMEWLAAPVTPMTLCTSVGVEPARLFTAEVVDCSGTATGETEVATTGVVDLVVAAVTAVALCTIVGVEIATLFTAEVVDGCGTATVETEVATEGVTGLVAESVAPLTPVTPCAIVEVGPVASLVAAGTTAGIEVAGAEVTGDSDGGVEIEGTGASEEVSGFIAVGAAAVAPVGLEDGGVASIPLTGPGTEAVELGSAGTGSVVASLVALLLALLLKLVIAAAEALVAGVALFAAAVLLAVAVLVAAVGLDFAALVAE